MFHRTTTVAASMPVQLGNKNLVLLLHKNFYWLLSLTYFWSLSLITPENQKFSGFFRWKLRKLPRNGLNWKVVRFYGLCVTLDVFQMRLFWTEYNFRFRTIAFFTVKYHFLYSKIFIHVRKRDVKSTLTFLDNLFII